MPFLYPCLETQYTPLRESKCWLFRPPGRRSVATRESQSSQGQSESYNTFLDPLPEDYGRTIFADKCTLSVRTGSGGNGCVSFLRDKFIADGPANGGDGGSGGNIYIQATEDETSLHKLARRGMLRAGKGQHGRGRNKGGQRGEDIVIRVPVGTVIREISRHDPSAEASERTQKSKDTTDESAGDVNGRWRGDQWILYPSSKPSDFMTTEFPTLPRNRRSNLSQPASPIHLDLSHRMDNPMLLAAGAIGGLGNPHFSTKSITKPKFATKGEVGMALTFQLELKLIADVGLVGLPNAGKSTLLRAISGSRARIGNWAFTTLQPNIGTVVLDNNRGRPLLHSNLRNGQLRTQFSIADIPGLVPEAHLDRGLGLGFLRHIERARVLAFVIDVSAGDGIETLRNLWTELRQFEVLRDKEISSDSERRSIDPTAWGDPASQTPNSKSTLTSGREKLIFRSSSQPLPALEIPPISSKPWFIVATKADTDSAQTNFLNLRLYLDALGLDALHHLSGQQNGWKGKLALVPVSAIRGEGIDRVIQSAVSLLDH